MNYRFMALSISIIFITTSLDQLVKYWIIETLDVGQYIDVLPFLALLHARNPGIAFSKLSSFGAISLSILTISIILFVIWLLWTTPASKKLTRIGYILILGGAFGNLIDRLRFHYVTDYVLIYMDKWSFAIFNLADIFITIGVIFIIIGEFIFETQKKNTSSNYASQDPSS